MGLVDLVYEQKFQEVLGTSLGLIKLIKAIDWQNCNICLRDNVYALSSVGIAY